MSGAPDHLVSIAPGAAQPDALRRTIPNLLTVLRLVIAVAFFVLLATWTYPMRQLVVTPTHPVWAYLVAAALFGLAALTDAIDGPLARRWNAVSVFGRVMDPFADKVLVVGAFIMLAGPRFAIEVPGRPYFQVSGVEPWMAVVILGRELLVTSIRAIAESSGKDFSADWSGKAKMILQACAIPFILVMLGLTEVKRGTPGRLAIDLAVWTTLAVTVLSAVPYIARAVRVLR